MMMQLEVILPLIAYLLVVFGCPFTPCVNAQRGFLNEYFLGSRSMGGLCWP
jgi:sodium/pantothenate symporter